MIDDKLSTVLPYVSMSAVKRVKDHLPIPTECNICGSPVRLGCNFEIYGESYGDWPYMYICKNTKCKAYVGLHPKTDLPLGTLADSQTRSARKESKSYFLTLSSVKFKNDRNKSYRWLANKLNINKSKCHFGMFYILTCNKAKDICKAEINNL